MLSFNTRQVALLSVSTAVSLSIQLTPRPIPNVEFTSLFTFLIGILYGGIIGGFFGGFVMFVNGFLSPWGFGGLFIPFQMAGMVIIGFAGGLYGNLIVNPENSYKKIRESAGFHMETAVIGAFLTTIYQMLMVVAITFVSATSLFVALISSIWFMVLHISSNTIIFGLLVFPLSYAIRKFLGE